jgi:Uncharacterized protein conserved in bacteria (DUF2325)
MCDHANCVASQNIGVETPADTSLGSLRTKLWQLPHKLFCPVIGVCLPLVILRQMVKKIYLGSEKADDYALHVGVISECASRNQLSLALQRELDKRYAIHIKQFKVAKSKLAVAQLWLAAINQGDLAGAFWAAATHPRCDTELHDVLYKDMHMLQHQAGACVRAELHKFNAVMQENATLARELAHVQERVTRVLTEKSAEIENLRAAQVQLQAKIISKDSQIASVTADFTDFKAGIPELEARKRLQMKVEILEQRQSAQLAHISDLRQQLQNKAESETASAEIKANSLQASMSRRVIPIVVQLQQKSVLCVGGRVGNVASYREAVERVGGRFAHHDGGVEDNEHLLDASLAAADMVICQTGCISHNAYWRVKDFCKRTGKQCVFVENPSVSSLTRGLEQLVTDERQPA